MAYVFKIRGSVKNYEWGKQGYQSIVAVLQNAAHEDFEVGDKPHAELWLGTHESGPATIPHLNNMKLREWMLQNEQCVGNNITQKFDLSLGLPFLFKVLSVNKPLSIQAHPDKITAAKLHQDFPQHYPDDNHKPELAIALTSFEALCGFRPISEIKHFFQEIQELRAIIDSKQANVFLVSGESNDLRAIFSAVMISSSSTYQASLKEIAKNFKQNKYLSELACSIKDIFLKTYDQYPDDIGCLCFFFLNYLQLKCGEAIFLAANEPHAYLYGDCIECMACSDNVVRAGLTPKYRDVQTLCSILTYTCKSKEENIYPVVIDANDPFVKIYNPPVKEFSVDSISLPFNFGVYNLKVLQSASILLVIKGNGICEYDKEEINLEIGVSLFISSNCSLKIKSETELVMFRAYCN